MAETMLAACHSRLIALDAAAMKSRRSSARGGSRGSTAIDALPALEVVGRIARPET